MASRGSSVTSGANSSLLPPQNPGFTPIMVKVSAVAVAGLLITDIAIHLTKAKIAPVVFIKIINTPITTATAVKIAAFIAFAIHAVGVYLTTKAQSPNSTELKNQIAELKNSLAQEEQNLSEELTRLKQENRTLQTSLKTEKTASLEKINQLTDLQNRYEALTAKQKEQVEESEENVDKTLQLQYEKEIAALKSQIKELNAAYQAKEKALLENHEREKAELESHQLSETTNVSTYSYKTKTFEELTEIDNKSSTKEILDDLEALGNILATLSDFDEDQYSKISYEGKRYFTLLETIASSEQLSHTMASIDQMLSAIKAKFSLITKRSDISNVPESLNTVSIILNNMLPILDMMSDQYDEEQDKEKIENTGKQVDTLKKALSSEFASLSNIATPPRSAADSPPRPSPKVSPSASSPSLSLAPPFPQIPQSPFGSPPPPPPPRPGTGPGVALGSAAGAPPPPPPGLGMPPKPKAKPKTKLEILAEQVESKRKEYEESKKREEEISAKFKETNTAIKNLAPMEKPIKDLNGCKIELPKKQKQLDEQTRLTQAFEAALKALKPILNDESPFEFEGQIFSTKTAKTHLFNSIIKNLPRFNIEVAKKEIEALLATKNEIEKTYPTTDFEAISKQYTALVMAVPKLHKERAQAEAEVEKKKDSYNDSLERLNQQKKLKPQETPFSPTTKQPKEEEQNFVSAIKQREEEKEIDFLLNEMLEKGGITTAVEIQTQRKEQSEIGQILAKRLAANSSVKHTEQSSKPSLPQTNEKAQDEEDWDTSSPPSVPKSSPPLQKSATPLPEPSLDNWGAASGHTKQVTEEKTAESSFGVTLRRTNRATKTENQ